MTTEVKATIGIKNDKYYIIISYYVNNDGRLKRIQRWIATDLLVSGNNKRKVEQKRLALLKEWQERVMPNDNAILLADYLITSLEETRYTISQNTYFDYRYTVHNVIAPYFFEKKTKLYELKPYHLQDFYRFKMDKDRIMAATVHRYHAIISKLLNHAVKTERLNSNPASKVELPKKQKHVSNIYTANELKRLLDSIRGSSIETPVLLSAWFGLRRGEAVGLKWSNIDFDNEILYIVGTIKEKGEGGSKKQYLRYESTAKTSSSIRSFPMAEIMIRYLRELYAKQQQNKKAKHYNHTWDDFVCVRNNGNLIPLAYISRVFPKLCEKAGLKRLKLHELRHTNISLLLENGASMKELQMWAGHSSYSTTANIYAHVPTKAKHKLMESLEKMIC